MESSAVDKVLKMSGVSKDAVMDMIKSQPPSNGVHHDDPSPEPPQAPPQAAPQAPPPRIPLSQVPTQCLAQAVLSPKVAASQPQPPKQQDHRRLMITDMKAVKLEKGVQTEVCTSVCSPRSSSMKDSFVDSLQQE